MNPERGCVEGNNDNDMKFRYFFPFPPRRRVEQENRIKKTMKMLRFKIFGAGELKTDRQQYRVEMVREGAVKWKESWL